MDDARSNVRVIILQILVVLAFGLLAAKLWQLQIAEHDQYVQMADTNRFRLVSADSPRGIIYDRNGQILVRNVPSFRLSVVPAALPEDEQLLAQLGDRVASLLQQPLAEDTGPELVPSAMADTTGQEGPVAALKLPSTQELYDSLTGILEQVHQGELAAYTPVTLVSNVSREAAFIAQEEAQDLPGVVVEITPEREYLEGPLTAHWLGYVGPIPEGSLASYMDKPASDYSASDQVGLAGIELTYEDVLRGSKEKKHVEVDVFQRKVDVLATKPGAAGDSLVLTMDLELQRVATEALQERMDQVGSQTGAAIAMNPKTGEILAMVSLPNYDDNLFSGGISVGDYNKLINDPLSPLLNHAIGGEYPPGSTFKIVVASGALQEKVITPDTTFNSEGTLLLPNEFFPDDPSKAQVFHDWRAGLGRLNLNSAIALSSDIYFYQVGGGFPGRFEGLGLERLGSYARAFGFGAPTGIDLSGEASGLVPTERWKRDNWDLNWTTGDTYNMSIGQGYILATPLQVLDSVVAIANGGTLYRPQVVERIVDSEGGEVQHLTPEVIRQIPVSPDYLQLVRQGMRACVQWGNAVLLELDHPEIHAAGKTGTAEFPGERDEHGILPTHAWFGCFAPYEDPEIALVVFLAGGGQGALEAVPVASKILGAYFESPEPTPTPAP